MERLAKHRKQRYFRFHNELSPLEAKEKAGEIRGFDNEKRALEIAKGPLKKTFRRIKYLVDPCVRDVYGRKQKGRDLKFTFRSPRILRGKEIYLEIKSSRTGARNHRDKGKAQLIYRAGVVIVRRERDDEKISRAMFNFIKNEARRSLEEVIGRRLEKWHLKWIPKKLVRKIIIWLSS